METLSGVIDRLNEAFFYGRNLTKKERNDAAVWLAGRLGKDQSYSGLFGLTQKEMAADIRVFTGEPLTTRAGKKHVLGEEAARVLNLLAVDSPEVKCALKQITGLVAPFVDPHRGNGYFCCGKCSAAMWRHLSVSRAPYAEARVTAGVEFLRNNRIGNGEWRPFPFYYTVLSLVGIDQQNAREELRYVAPRLERLARRSVDKRDKYALRRHDLVERALALV